MKPPFAEYLPTWRTRSVTRIPYAFLLGQEKRGLILDIENTIVPKGEREIPPDIMEHLQQLQIQGIKLCLLSNQTPWFVYRHMQTLGCDGVACILTTHWPKPSPGGYLAALKQLNLRPHQVIVVGDQLPTDIRGANRAGIESILVDPLSEKDSILTQRNRVQEAVIRDVWRQNNIFVREIFEPPV